MNPMFSRTLKALCVVMAATLLSACGGASSTVDPFIATRVIAFGDGFNQVDAHGSGVSTVRASDLAVPTYVTDDTIAGRIATRYGIVVKGVAGVAAGGPSLAATGGFSYAIANARVADVDAQITAFLNAAGTVSDSFGCLYSAIDQCGCRAHRRHATDQHGAYTLGDCLCDGEFGHHTFDDSKPEQLGQYIVQLHAAC